MRFLLCRLFGHRYTTRHHPRFFTCTRCGEPGFWIPS